MSASVLLADWINRFPLGQPPRRPIRLGLIGLGAIARSSHVPAIETLQAAGWPVTISHLCDPVAERLEEFSPRFPDAQTTFDAADVVGTSEVDAVVLMTPAAISVKLLPLALHMGLPVLVEKPVAPSAGQLEAVVAGVGPNYARLAHVAYNRRFQPLGLLSRQELPALGQVERVRVQLWRVARTRHDFYEDVPVHALDFLASEFGPLQLLRCEVSAPPAPGALPAGVHLTLTTAAGIPVELDVRPAAGITRENYDYEGSVGSMRLAYLVHEARHPIAPAEFQFQAKGQPARQIKFEPKGMAQAEAVFLRGFTHQLAAFLRFAETKGESESPCGLTDAIAALRLTQRVTDAIGRTTDPRPPR